MACKEGKAAMENETQKEQGSGANSTLVAGITLAGLLIALIMIGSLSLVSADSAAVSSVDSWNTVFTETFESGISAGWVVTDADGTTGGEYYWATTTVTASEGTSSAWATGGGTDGSLLTPGTDNYPDNALSSMIHMPVDLTGTTGVRLSFDYWTDTEQGLDVLQVVVSTDGATFNPVDTLSGDSTGWQSKVIDLGAYAGESSFSAGFLFSSNSATGALGAFVDNVALESSTGQISYLPVLRMDPTPTPVPYMYFDDFSDSNSGWFVGDNRHVSNDCWRWWYDGDAQYKAEICDDRTDVKVSPLIELPTGDYVLEVDARFEDTSGWWTSYGIIFDGKDDPDPQKGDLGDYYMLWVLKENVPGYKWKILKDFPGGQDHLQDWQVLDPSVFNYGSNGTEWNNWRIERTDTNVRVYLNGHLLADYLDARPTTNYQVLFGLFASTYETNYTRIAFDNYSVKELGGSSMVMPATGKPIAVTTDFDLEDALPSAGD